MRPDKLFNRTRLSIAFGYSSVIGVIFAIVGYGVYTAIANAHTVTLERELESLAKTLHNSLELKLARPGRIDPIVRKWLPDLCVNGTPCFSDLSGDADRRPCPVRSPAVLDPIDFPTHHQFKFIGKGEYYLRLLDLRGCPLASAGTSPPFRFSPEPPPWRTVVDANGNRYREFSGLLHASDRRNWGYLQVGRSFQDLDSYLATVRRILLSGYPIALGLVGLSSWWLAGLAMKPIYRSYQQIQQFTADVAHELRTPLSATGATLEVVVRNPDIGADELQELFSVFYRQNQRLTALVRDLLLLSRLERRSIPAEARACCLNEIAGDLLEEFAGLALEAGIELGFVDRVGQPLYVGGDLDELYRLFSNLLVNALQYTPRQGKVRLILEANHHEAIAIVRDTGIGISREDRKRIFDRFYRVEGDRSRQTGGSGLGLAIAREIVRSHRGKIEVKSEPGRGSLFIVRLPRYSGLASDS